MFGEHSRIAGDGGMLARIRASLSTMTPAERRAGETFLANPQATIGWSLADAAAMSQVSEPSVLRFCRRLGFDGYSDFRIGFAQAVALMEKPDPQHPPEGDPIRAAVQESCAQTIATVNDVMADVEPEAVAAAVEILRQARRIDVYGHGASGFMAGEAQNRFAYLGLASAAYSDPALQMFSSVSLGPRDCVLALSFSGVTTHLMPNLETARSAGARVIALAPSGSPIARLADVTVAVNAYRQKKTPQLLSNERVAMFIMLDVIVRLLGERLKG